MGTRGTCLGCNSGRRSRGHSAGARHWEWENTARGRRWERWGWARRQGGAPPHLAARAPRRIVLGGGRASSIRACTGDSDDDQGHSGAGGPIQNAPGGGRDSTLATGRRARAARGRPSFKRGTDAARRAAPGVAPRRAGGWMAAGRHRGVPQGLGGVTSGPAGGACARVRPRPKWLGRVWGGRGDGWCKPGCRSPRRPDAVLVSGLAGGFGGCARGGPEKRERRGRLGGRGRGRQRRGLPPCMGRARSLRQRGIKGGGSQRGRGELGGGGAASATVPEAPRLVEHKCRFA